MRYSKLFPKTSKDTPKDEVSVNAKLLLQGGFIDKLMAGSYTLLPLGKRVEKKIEEIVRKGINEVDSQEILMPLLHPKDIWNETGRWDEAKDVMYQFEKDDKSYALSFTHEEILMDLLRKHINSYKDLPVSMYQFSTKFRNELRAKSGILRGREFLMKDQYSAHATKEDLMDYYWKVAKKYIEIYESLGLKAHIAEASGGVFTKEVTHEFQVESSVGEDTIYMADGWEYAKNEEIMTDADRSAPGLKTLTTIEVGNIFPFGTKKYSELMGGEFTDKDGTRQKMHFASYGIGITRLIGVLAEVYHDDRGLMWPEAVAPFQVHLIEISNADEAIKQKADQVYKTLQEKGVEVLYDERIDIGAGQKFADADLLGMPVRLVVSSKTGDSIEYKRRDSKELEMVSIDEVLTKLTK